MFTLVHIATGEFDSDWHRTYEAANMHRIRCFGARTDGWYVCELTAEQAAQAFAIGA